MTDQAQYGAAYVGWTTFINAITNLSQGIPNQIDRTTFPGLSGGVQSQLLNAMKFLGLINEDATPTAALHALAVEDEAKRKAKLKDILEKRYASIIALDLMKATPGQVISKLGEEYGVSGETREKALRFFLMAAQYAGITFSRFFKIPSAVGTGNGGGATRRRRTVRARQQPEDDEVEDQPPPRAPGGTSRVVQLKSGGTLTLNASLDLFQLSPADRNFVFGLIDKLDGYEKENVEPMT